jgi:hypothetical protein
MCEQGDLLAMVDIESIKLIEGPIMSFLEDEEGLTVLDYALAGTAIVLAGMYIHSPQSLLRWLADLARLVK